MRDVIMYILICSYGFLMCYLGYEYHKDTHKCPKLEKEIVVKDTLSELTLDNVLKEIIKQDIKYPLIVYRQVIWETGWLKCKGCSLNYNNLFGIRHKKWVTKDNPMGYKEEKDWRESITSYKDLIQNQYKEGDYYLFLYELGYAEDENYIKNLKSIQL